MKKKVVYLLCGLLLLSCTNKRQRDYFAVAGSSWEGAVAANNDYIRLDFYSDSVDITYENKTYNGVSYHYEAQHLQGSIALKDFSYSDDSEEDVVWLFAILPSDATREALLELNFFMRQDKSRNTVYLLLLG